MKWASRLSIEGCADVKTESSGAKRREKSRNAGKHNLQNVTQEEREEQGSAAKLCKAEENGSLKSPGISVAEVGCYYNGANMYGNKHQLQLCMRTLERNANA